MKYLNDSHLDEVIDDVIDTFDVKVVGIDGEVVEDQILADLGNVLFVRRDDQQTENARNQPYWHNLEFERFSL